MKSWGKRRKAKEQASLKVDSLVNTDTKAQPSPTSFGKSLRRKKTHVVEVKPELDLATALPDTKDFRTSLMMPTFSARFSMLRELDDPDTKIGKASDDSVLFPKRASRMNLFTHNPLTDIAEVDSIRGSTFRPPFAENGRSQSFSEGYASDDGGSIMSRSKPGEGNNLFGGRQKLYRVPANQDNEGSGPPLGRHMYESDVSMSMFQQLRLKERMERASEDTFERPGSLQQTDTEDADTVNSPSTGFSKNRGTTSSTTSAPSNRRTSTAATSVASESPALPQNNSTSSVNRRISDQSSAVERNGTLHKRLYGATLDQVSPNRKNFRDSPENAFKTRAPSNPKLTQRLSQSRSATNLGDKYARQNQVFATSAYRAASPPPSALVPSFPPMDLGLRDGKRSGSPADARNNMTTPVSEDEDVVTYTQNVQPNDRGKATAMGLFNRPQRQFDEQQFTQRQLQMAEGRNSPAPTREGSSRAESRASEVQEQRPSNEAKNRFAKSRASPDSSKDRDSPLGDRAPPSASRPRNKSSASVAAAMTVKARAEELIRRENAELAALEARRFGLDQPTAKAEQAPASTQPAANGTFLDTFDASDDESELDSRHQSTRQPQSKGPDVVHPALRNGSLEFDFGDAVSKQVSSNDTTPNHSHESLSALPQTSYSHNETLTSNTYDSNPSAGTNTMPGLGLASMISHMRDHSTSSSVYPPQSPAIPPPSPHYSRGSQVETPRAASIASTARILNPPESTHSDPWDLDRFSSQQQDTSRENTTQDPTAQMAKKAQQMLGLATALKEKSKAQQILGDEAPNNEEYSQWQEDSRSMHQRDLSSGTQKERDDFESELAEARRKVKESLKTAVDSGSRSPSPGPSTRRSPSMSGNPFSVLKHRPSKASLTTKSAEPTSSSKAMKMLGISGQPPVNQTFTKRPQHNAWQEEEERMLQDFGRRPKQRSPEDYFENPRRSPPRDQSTARYRDQSSGRSGRSTPYDEERDRARQRSATPTSGRTSRNRSDSATSGRSKSRQGRYRDDTEPALPGSFPITPVGEMRSPMMGGPYRRPEPSVDPRQYGRSDSAMSNRQRSNSRPGVPEQRDGSLRRGPSLMTATMPSGQSMRSPRPILSPHESMPSPRETTDDFSRDSPPDQSMMPRQPPSDGPMRSPRRAPMPPGPDDYAKFQSSSPHMTEFNMPRSAQPSPRMASGPRFEIGRITPTSNGRTTPNAGGRKKSVSKHMISEPTFLSSTSSVPLVTLPSGQTVDAHGPAPMLPPQNPRRRGTTPTQSMFSGAGKAYPHEATSLFPEMIPESPDRMHFHTEEPLYRPMAADQKKPRNRLRKSSSEGGNMAAKAARQAMHMDHLASPQVPTFPNRSATNLARDGGMF